MITATKLPQLKGKAFSKPTITGHTKNIHIHAKCPYFEIHEIVPEEKAVKRLEGLRDVYRWYNETSNMKLKVGEAKLSVTTGVHNPTLF